MRSTTLALMPLCWLLALAAPAQRPARILQTVAGWHNAAGKRISVTKTTTTTSKGRLLRADTLQAIYHFTIVAAHDTGYVVRWRMVAQAGNAQTNTLPQAIADNTLMQAFYLDIATDAFGGYVGLANPDMLSSQIERITNGLQQFVSSDSSVRGQQIYKAFLLMRQEGMVAKIMQEQLLADAQLYLLNYGKRFKVGQPEQDSLGIENQLGGARIPALRTALVSAPKRHSGDYHIHSRSQTDSAQTARIFTDTMRDLAQRAYGPTVTDKRYPPMRLIHQYDYYYQAATGWMRKVVWQKQVQSSTVQRVEATTIQLLGDL